MLDPETDLADETPRVRELCDYWQRYMRDNVVFNMPDSPIHAMSHCERVLAHALSMAAELFEGDEDAITALAHAAIFHDTRRQDDYLDTGHGARAAVYYKAYCDSHPDLNYDERAALLMRYHDLDDELGVKAIERRWGIDTPESRRVRAMYSIFKDADALDRWRLGRYGLDPKFLRTDAAARRVERARRLVEATVDPDLLRELDELVAKAYESQNKANADE